MSTLRGPCESIVYNGLPSKSGQTTYFLYGWTFASVSIMYTFLQGVVNNNIFKKTAAFYLFMKPDSMKSGNYVERKG